MIPGTYTFRATFKTEYGESISSSERFYVIDYTRIPEMKAAMVQKVIENYAAKPETVVVTYRHE